MKNKVLILTLLLVVAMLFNSCILQPTMTHTHPDNPTGGSTTVNPSIFGPGHDDNDNNGICDNCGGTFVDSRCMGAKCAEDGEHVWGEYKSNEYVHWREYICGHGWPDIAEEHMDTDENGICDVCGADVSEGIIVIDPPPCGQRKDENGDGYCDVCGWSLADMPLDVPCFDCNSDGVCDDCGEDTLTGLHLDNDYNGVCDICQSDIEISLIWHYTDTWHWMTYDDRHGPVPDVVFSEGEHVDEDIDGTCDLCKYKMTE